MLELEVRRAVLRGRARLPAADRERLLTTVHEILGRFFLFEISRAVLVNAGTLEGPMLRSLDALHVATALEMPERLEAFVSYDARQLSAARDAGLPTCSPGAPWRVG